MVAPSFFEPEEQELQVVMAGAHHRCSCFYLPSPKAAVVPARRTFSPYLVSENPKKTYGLDDSRRVRRVRGSGSGRVAAGGHTRQPAAALQPAAREAGAPQPRDHRRTAAHQVPD